MGVRGAGRCRTPQRMSAGAGVSRGRRVLQQGLAGRRRQGRPARRQRRVVPDCAGLCEARRSRQVGRLLRGAARRAADAPAAAGWQAGVREGEDKAKVEDKAEVKAEQPVGLEAQHVIAWALRHPTAVDLGPCDKLGEIAPRALALMPEKSDEGARGAGGHGRSDGSERRSGGRRHRAADHFRAPIGRPTGPGSCSCTRSR